MTSAYSLVMRAYPKPYRNEHGDELVFTANELSDGWTFRQSRSLLVEGLRTRARLATDGSPAKAWSSAVAMALGFLHLSWFAVLLAYPLGAFEPVELDQPYWVYSLVVGLPVVALTISSRWPTAVIACSILLFTFVVGLEHVDGIPLVTMAANHLLEAIAFIWLATRTNGPRAFSPTVAVSGLVALVSMALISGAIVLAFPVLVLGLFIVLGLMLTTIDPRPLIAAVFLSSFQVLRSVGILLDSPPMWIVAIVSLVVLAFICLSLLARNSARRVQVSGRNMRV